MSRTFEEIEAQVKAVVAANIGKPLQFYRVVTLDAAPPTVVEARGKVMQQLVIFPSSEFTGESTVVRHGWLVGEGMALTPADARALWRESQEMRLAALRRTVARIETDLAAAEAADRIGAFAAKQDAEATAPKTFRAIDVRGLGRGLGHRGGK